MIIAVIGTGLMGGSFCKAFKEYSDCTVYAYDSDKETCAKLIDTKSADKILNDRLLKEADIIFVCLKPQLTIKFIKENSFKFKKRYNVYEIVKCCKKVVSNESKIRCKAASCQNY